MCFHKLVWFSMTQNCTVDKIVSYINGQMELLRLFKHNFTRFYEIYFRIYIYLAARLIIINHYRAAMSLNNYPEHDATNNDPESRIMSVLTK
jgi:hypothetical protein